MKKIVLSLAGVLAATAFAPEAAAIPAYARQVGMACSACHQQHFPVLNTFGRAFKAGGYTMMGAQGKVEGDHLSIPDTLNASMIVKLRYMKDNTTASDVSKSDRPTTKADGQLQMFDEFALLVGGRIAENVGVFMEGQMLETGPLIGILRMPFVFDMGAAKVSVVPFAADGGSAMVGYELSSGGILRANRWSESRKETSAVQYNSNIESAAGFAFVAQNDMGFVNVTKFTSDFGFKDQGEKSSALNSTYLRAAVTPTVGDWAIVGGVGVMSGQSWNIGEGATVQTEQTFIDFQAHGEVAGKELGVYAQYSNAPKVKNAGDISAYNTNGVTDKKALTIGADYTVIPHSLSIGAAYRKADNGAATNTGDDAITVQAVYDMYQNVALHAIFSTYSGSYYDANPTKATNLTTLMLEMAW
ncbi:MAG: hypothetical protein A3H31_06840 [Gallionellales bacterium RIFCSPLOWO2_02_FULL_57_47]|nr:MAG: hypothetical protein A3H31_06840 [Gallionellales bacterium RIFCSPLOWO2_02_FULL_57_47]OGT11772.1 MAG: hypothetical protein A3J49_15930 [Gallionellales bacterium RIFCSPHIGHO2_02_FULL_57_16]